MQYSEEEQQKAKQSRLRTTLQNYDQVVAISENGINANLSASWKPRIVKMETENATINGTLAAPSVEFEENVTKTIFYVNFLHLSISVDTIVAHQIKTVTKDFNGWSLAYEVKIAYENIKALPEDIKQQVKNFVDYTPQQILIDFSTANLDEARPTFSKYPGIDAAGDEHDIAGLKSAMNDFGKDWISKIKKKEIDDVGILGYALKSDPAKGPAATLEPKDLTLQTYPYYRNGTSVAADFVRQDSCFCFLNVFGKNQFPTISEGGAVKTMDYSGNLTSPFAKVSVSGITIPAAGSTTISGRCFWEALKPTLDALSRATFFSVNSVWAYADTNIAKNKYDYKLGIGAKNNDTMPNLEDGGKYKDVVGNDFQVRTMKYDYTKTAENVAGPNGITTQTWVSLQVKGHNNFSWSPGTSVISVCGSSEYRAQAKYKVLLNWHEQLDSSFSWSWSYDIALSIAPDGRLQLKVQNSSGNNNIVYYKVLGPFGAMMIWFTLSHIYTEEELEELGIKNGLSHEEYRKISEKIMQDTFDVSVARMDQALGTVSEFVFPAAGQYWMADPRFNNEGDLTCDLGLMAPKKPQ